MFLQCAVLIVSADAVVDCPYAHESPHICSRDDISKVIFLIHSLESGHNILQSLVVRVVDIQTTITATLGCLSIVINKSNHT